jgi:hypothetical protein
MSLSVMDAGCHTFSAGVRPKSNGLGPYLRAFGLGPYNDPGSFREDV